MSQPTVFISYSHDSEAHREQVLGLSERLRKDGIETRLDQYVNGSPEEGWPRWMLNQLDEAQFVLVVCSETYYRRFRGYEEPNKGKGVDWEGALITQEIYDSRSKTLKFVPVFLNAAVDTHIPEPLRSITHYALTSENNYQSLYDFLLGQAGVEPHPVGTLKTKPRQQGGVLSFDEPQPSEAAKIDISRIIKYAPAELIGRVGETKVLNDAWNQAVNGEPKRPHVLTFVALGGEGKTSLVAKWAAELAHDDWPDCEAVFAWSFYSQGMRESASSDLFLKEALVFFGDDEMAQSSRGAYDKGKRLAKLVGEKRALLILDGVEPLQYPPMPPMDGKLKDDGIAALLKGLAANSLGLCVATTRYSIPDLKAYWQGNAPMITLKRLSNEAGVALLKSLDVHGTQPELETLVEDVRGHALTLNLFGSYLRDAHAGDIRKRDLIKLEEADAEEQGGHAFRVMDAYVSWFKGDSGNAEENKKAQRALAVLRLLGLFDRPVSADCFYALLKAPAIPHLTELLVEKNEARRNMALTRLENAKLLTVSRDASGALLSLDTHPLLREYFSKQLREQHHGSWREAHRRLYKHLCATTIEGEQPTLEELQPLYQAVTHGCLAGLQLEVFENVFYKRLDRQEAYCWKKLGAFGTTLGGVACFFEQQWDHVSPALRERNHVWLLNEAAVCLRALGRLTEAVAPAQAGLEDCIKRKQWGEATRLAHNLSELELMLGEIIEALRHAEQSVIYADRDHDALFWMASRTIHADALHQAGRRVEAEERFNEAKKIQDKSKPGFPLLYSTPAFRYCDLLLTAPECAAWKTILERNDMPPSNDMACSKSSDDLHHFQTLLAVSQGAAQMLKVTEKDAKSSVLDKAFDHITLGRTALYTAILEGSSLTPCQVHIGFAVNGFLRSGNMDDLPSGLLTRAWLRALEGNHTGHESAQSDLDEAMEIAERGPMPLYMADIYLHRARLFFRVTPYPWSDPDGTLRSAKQDLADARRLIEKHGYWRRKEELEDAEAVILNASGAN